MVLSSFCIRASRIKLAMARTELRLFLVLLFACALFTAALATDASSQQQQQQRRPRPGSIFVNWQNARSLLRSLLHRIINHRLLRGDTQGAERIRGTLASVDNLFLFWKNAGSMGWDYLVNYSWRLLDPSQILDILRLINEVQSAVAELLQWPSDLDRLRWISANYGQIFQITKSALEKLLNVFDHPGALQDFVLAMQTEIVRGDILRDALQLAAADFQGLVQVAKEMLQNYGAVEVTDVL